ncbi:hypothetical protein V565_009250 [Rhizoctonia solani 123E]|uniref:BZIP domain-containing protein n=1 Tax=Rhizoctonia solani 123E TaxID=1423351 RepID=A0A074SDY6_9AGAM|nr:hypothetical protein V565_009250 [Rhizoctonia solani 123E]
MSPAARISHSPPSTHEDELAGTGLQSRSRNARAQARHRAKRKKYIETLEDTVKRLQTIVDAAGLDPNAFPPPMQSAHVHSHPYLRDLQDDNARLRREADALRVQIAALTAHVSAGGSHVTSSLPLHYAPSPSASDAHTPPPNSERDHKKRKMSAERDHGPLYLDSHPQGRTSPASASTSSLATTNSSIHTQTGSTSASSLSMLSPLQQQVVYNSLFSGLGSAGNSTPSVSTGTSSQPSHASRPASPPMPVSTFAQMPTTSLLATSLYPLLTLGIAGGAVSGELGAAAWNAFQQSQLAQQGLSSGQHQHHSSFQQSQSGLGHSLGQGLPGLHNPSSFMSHSQPMSTLSSNLDTASGLPAMAGLSRMDSGSTSTSGLRMDSPSGLPQSLESMRTSSPGDSSSSPPRFDSSRFESSARFDPPTGTSRFDATSSSLFDHPSNSPHMMTGTPPGFASSNSSTPGLPGRHLPEGRRSSGSSRRDDVP